MIRWKADIIHVLIVNTYTFIGACVTLFDFDGIFQFPITRRDGKVADECLFCVDVHVHGLTCDTFDFDGRFSGLLLKLWYRCQFHLNTYQSDTCHLNPNVEYDHDTFHNLEPSAHRAVGSEENAPRHPRALVLPVFSLGEANPCFEHQCTVWGYVLNAIDIVRNWWDRRVGAHRSHLWCWIIYIQLIPKRMFTTFPQKHETIYKKIRQHNKRLILSTSNTYTSRANNRRLAEKNRPKKLPWHTTITTLVTLGMILYPRHQVTSN